MSNELKSSNDEIFIQEITAVGFSQHGTVSSTKASANREWGGFFIRGSINVILSIIRKLPVNCCIEKKDHNEGKPSKQLEMRRFLGLFQTGVQTLAVVPL